MTYFAKSPNKQGHQETVKEHLQKVADLALEYGEPLGLGIPAWTAGQTHDIGKYTQDFQDVLRGTKTGVDHAIGGACFLEICYRGSAESQPVIETDTMTAFWTMVRFGANFMPLPMKTKEPAAMGEKNHLSKTWMN